MELLLNLAWLLMALPAYWLWRQDASARAARRVSSGQCLLALACILVLLFPVISASDDLHAMRAEMEESSATKRSVRSATGDKVSGWLNRSQPSPAMVVAANWFFVPEVRGFAPARPAAVSPRLRASFLCAGRAPPFSLLG
jgi:hypothetical protein